MFDRRRLKAGVLVLVAGCFTGCQSMPRAGLESYQQNFAIVRNGAQDLYLRAGFLAENVANRPEAEGSVTDRIKKLERWRKSIKARQAAISLIDQYNRALSHLAAGASAEALGADITGIQQDLSSFNISHVKQLLKDSSPYLNVLVQGITLIENEIKKKKFRDAVLAAQKPLVGILDILIDDADDLENLFRQELLREQDPYRIPSSTIETSLGC
ncbi:MAG: hypothetical protein A3J70_12845 [Elusimicrobia bacterium RIFCSPHIGHO2_02_FULL_61_10]|nr:MAG: hypothetical protein A3J70_12845 [Elusimicrobia bacterium RIFCSPHIGHO2_02_FULL_61_10]